MDILNLFVIISKYISHIFVCYRWRCRVLILNNTCDQCWGLCKYSIELPVTVCTNTAYTTMLNHLNIHTGNGIDFMRYAYWWNNSFGVCMLYDIWKAYKYQKMESASAKQPKIQRIPSLSMTNTSISAIYEQTQKKTITSSIIFQ